jgi:hypothetical protein
MEKSFKTSVKSLAEKSLKTFLKKKKVGFTAGLLIAFLITGELGFASDEQVTLLQNKTDALQQELLERITAEKEGIQQLLIENEARLGELKKGHMRLVREGDWYSKPWYNSYFLSFNPSYTRADNQNKNWINPNSKHTLYDLRREEYLGESKKEYNGTGWIMNTDPWNSYTEVYDNEAKITIVPTLKSPTMVKPMTPAISFYTPSSPTILSSPVIPPPSISPINLSVGTLTMSLPTLSSVSLPNLDINIPEQNVNVLLNPIVIGEPTIDPQFNINTDVPSLSLQVDSPTTILEPLVSDPNRQIDDVNPNASPFTNYYLSSSIGMYNGIAAATLSNATVYSGIDPSTLLLARKSRRVIGGVIVDYTNRYNVAVYMHGQNKTNLSIVKDVEFYIAGNAGFYSDISPTQSTYTGTAGAHIVIDGKLENVTGNLYGRAAFITGEQWQATNIELINVKVNIKGEENSVFFIFPGTFMKNYTGGYFGATYQGKIIGNMDVDIPTRNNYIYSMTGAAGSYKIVSEGTYRLEGASNIVYSNMSYSADYDNLTGRKASYKENMTPSIQILEPAELYGDENIALFFGSKIVGTLPYIWTANDGTLTSAPFIGIYQGQIAVNAKIGEYLQIDTVPDTQTTEGDLSGVVGKENYTNKTVDGSVGIFAKSGQRAGINPNTHLGVPASLTDYTNNDPIHGLQIGQIDIKFGEYSKNNYMIRAEYGTIVDIAKPGTKVTQLPGASLSTIIFDGIDKNTDNKIDESEAATGTIIAYSKGVWDQTVHKLGSASILPVGHTSLSAFEGMGSEINMYIPVTITSKEGIAYFGDDNGIVNVYATATTEATGHKSIIGYARENGSVNIAADIKAVDKWATTGKYENIGAYAGKDGTVIITGNAEINGIGAFANDQNANALLKGSANIINTGINGGLAALVGGYVEFGGGVINHEELVADSGDHDGKTPFYADSTSKINFSGATTINISNGAVFNGNSSEFKSASGTTGKYNGMTNLTINLLKDGINIGAFKGETVNWDPSLPGGIITNLINPITKVGLINENGHKWAVSFVNGIFNINSDTDFNVDQLKNVILEKEKINISTAATITSTLGNSLVLGSNDTSIINSDSQINNAGKIYITGGTSADMAVGAYVSYGQINNTGTIKVDNGIGAYGVNGSKITNTGNIEITSSGLGIVGLSQSLSGADTYGTDNGESGNVIEIDNQGTLTVSGTGAIGIYAENNTGASRSDVIVKNNNQITLGDEGIGIMLKGTTDGGTVTLVGIGTSDIIVGENGIGIYVENTDLNIGTTYGIDVEDDGVGIYTKGNSSIAAGTLNFTYNGATDKSGAGIIYEGTGSSLLTNNININVNNATNTSGTIVGLYTNTSGTSPTSDQVTNNGNINLLSEGTYGIISESVDIVNNSVITTGNSSGAGGLGIFARDGSVITDGDDIVTAGSKAVGVYVESANTLVIPKKVTINQGTLAMSISGLKGIGAYILDKTTTGLLTLENNSDIIISDTADIADRKVGIVLSGTAGTNENNGNIMVGKNNLGIYNKNSKLENTGIIDVIHNENGTENIGIHSVADGKVFILENSGTINVTGVKNIGISAETDGINTGLIDITGGTINVTATSMADNDTPIGIYAKGDNITIQNTGTSAMTTGANGIGIYMEGDTSSQSTGGLSFKLSSDTSGKIGIGGYFKNGAHTTGAITVESTATALDGDGKPARPIGIYYGSGSTSNVSSITISSVSNEVIGMYVSGIPSFINSGNIIVNAKGIGAYYLNSNISNTGNVSANGTEAYGLLYNGGNSLSTGIITANGSKAIGVISTGTGSIYKNQGTIISNVGDSIGMVAVNSGKSQNAGTIIINNGYGAVAKGNGSIVELLLGSNITGAVVANLIGTSSIDNGEILINGGNITMDDNQIGVYSSGAKVTLRSGSITLGDSGVGVYSKNSTLDITGNLVNITMGDGSVGIYSENNTISGGNEELEINYTSTLMGIGIYYKGTISVVNKVEIKHNGNNLVHIYADGLTMNNISNQTVKANGIGIYGTNNATLSNTGELILSGLDSIGIYVDGGSTLTNIGEITGSSITDKKVGVYVENGDITGSNNYDFGIAGGLGIYLKNNMITYGGTLKLTGDSPSSTSRSIGIYASPILTGTLTTNLEITGKDAVGIYLSELGGTGANITYLGEMELNSASTNNRGVGAYLSQDSIFTLGSTGKVKISGVNNIGFYVNSGSTLNISGGTVENTIDGILAYLDGGIINFTIGSPLNINYANVIVSGITGQINNSTTITVGNCGLQGYNGSTITNTITGIINGTAENAKGLIASGIGTTIINNGKIELSDINSIGIYATNGAGGTSTGEVEVGDRSVGYYAGINSTINVSGISTIGKNSTLLYSDGGSINYTGVDIDLGELTTAAILKDAASTVNLNSKNITVGKKGTGIYVTGTGDINNVFNIGSISVGESGTGIFLEALNNANLYNNIFITGKSGIGILATNDGNITYGGTMSSTSENGMGIIAIGIGNILNQGDILLTGDSSIGVYGEDSTSIVNQTGSTIEVGNGTSVASSIGIYGNRAVQIINNGILSIKEYGVGIYGKDADIVNTGTIINTNGKNTGIYGVGGQVSNTGNIILSGESNGIYLHNGTNVTNNGNITVGNDNSSGIYGSGTTNVIHSAGLIKTGNNSVGVATDIGNITVLSGAQIQTGESSTHIYTESGNGINHANLNLAKYTIGMFTKTGTMENNGVITLGESDVSTPQMKISVGMATEKGTIENNGTIDIPDDYGIGMAVTDGGTAINMGSINVNGNNAYGMQGIDEAILENYGIINVNGNNARGITALNSTNILNMGVINVNGAGADGIYVESQSKVDNSGNIVVNGTGRTGIYIGSGGKILNEGNITLNGGGNATLIGAGTVVNVGDIIINGPKVTIDGITINNTGTITVNGPLDFNEVKISGEGTNDYIGTISAETFDKGEFLVLSDVTQGSNKDMYIVQYLQGTKNTPNNGNISAISQSVSYVVDLQKDPMDSNRIIAVLVKVPYIKMVQGTKAIEFGKGLDELYRNAVNMELKMFDSLDKISSDEELVSTFENELRGNEYANIQERMLDINNVFNSTYETLKHDRLYTKNSMKIGLITSKGESKYSDPAIIDYDQITLGFMVMKEYDTRTYGQKYGWHVGFAQNKFDFDNDSKETAYSLNVGMSYERILGGNDRLKWHTKGEVTVNHHEMNRRIDISGSKYSNDSRYWSGMAMVKNKIRYEGVTEGGKVRAGVQGTMDLGYGRYFNIKENGDGMLLQIPSTDMYTVRPGIGADIEFTKRTPKGSKISLKGKASVEYEFGRIYDGANKAKFRETNAGYYDLEKPKRERTIVKAGAELKYESINGNSISFEVIRQEGRIDSTRYGVNFMVRLDN